MGQPRREADRTTAWMVALFAGLAVLVLWAFHEGAVNCHQPGIVGPWC